MEEEEIVDTSPMFSTTEVEKMFGGATDVDKAVEITTSCLMEDEKAIYDAIPIVLKSQFCDSVNNSNSVSYIFVIVDLISEGLDEEDTSIYFPQHGWKKEYEKSLSKGVEEDASNSPKQRIWENEDDNPLAKSHRCETMAYLLRLYEILTVSTLLMKGVDEDVSNSPKQHVGDKEDDNPSAKFMKGQDEQDASTSTEEHAEEKMKKVI
ncbi:hypothetical protein PanWU01x14_105680 [Parasponia andersonii]|uniref:Uncharacterized protein n=1 Tax=Parasponia andersonii TaxID=3476 RepID=A0A2P5D117_PARAD|nr:hypothetical protein PanWU01x14_105680 [Parasponia andersonii]